jgi:hypothetical protein
MASLVLPNTISNGQAVDATPVQANFNQIVSFANSELVQRDGSVAMTGQLLLPADPSAEHHAARKGYVDSAIAAAIAGSTYVGTGQLANLAVTAAKLASNAVTTAKVADEAVTVPKLGGNRGGVWSRGSTQSVATATYVTVVPLATPLAFSGVTLGSGNGVFTVAAGYSGWWQLSFKAEFTANPGTSGQILIDANGVEYRAQVSNLARESAVVSVAVPLEAGQTVRAKVYQATGASIDVQNCRWSLLWVGPSS